MSSITLNAGEGSELAFDFPGLAGEYTITPTDLRPAMPKAGQKVARPVKKILMGSETKALVALGKVNDDLTVTPEGFCLASVADNEYAKEVMAFAVGLDGSIDWSGFLEKRGEQSLARMFAGAGYVILGTADCILP